MAGSKSSKLCTVSTTAFSSLLKRIPYQPWILMNYCYYTSINRISNLVCTAPARLLGWLLGSRFVMDTWVNGRFGLTMNSGCRSVVCDLHRAEFGFLLIDLTSKISERIRMTSCLLNFCEAEKLLIRGVLYYTSNIKKHKCKTYTIESRCFQDVLKFVKKTTCLNISLKF